LEQAKDKAAGGTGLTSFELANVTSGGGA